MCGAILTQPHHPEAQAGVVFIEPSGPVHTGISTLLLTPEDPFPGGFLL